MRARWALLALAAGLAGGSAGADTQAAVYCGSSQCLVVRAAAHGRAPDQRADGAMACLNKFLGGKDGRFTTVQHGAETQILLNGEELLVVTPDDARQEKAKSAAALALQWRNSLNKAFTQTRAQK